MCEALNMRAKLEETISLLERTPRALNALLRGLPDSWTTRDEGEKTWTVVDVLAHLIHTEKVNWMIRTEAILKFGESRTFDPLDREPSREVSRGRSVDELLDEFSVLRSKSVESLAALGLKAEDLDRRGRHPVFGEVTLSQLLATWAAHDLTHLHQISRIMAHQYREAVGPWNVYLGVLKCNGHSEP